MGLANLDGVATLSPSNPPYYKTCPALSFDLGKHMIERISISGTASYGGETQALERLAQFNYIYGPNGAGKTTISKVIADESQFSSCSVSWANGSSLKAFVYNRDFVEKNFTQARDLRGTLP